MLRLDSSEMLPGSQKGENRGLREKSWKHTLESRLRDFDPLTPASACNALEQVMITWHREM